LTCAFLDLDNHLVKFERRRPLEFSLISHEPTHVEGECHVCDGRGPLHLTRLKLDTNASLTVKLCGECLCRVHNGKGVDG